MNRTSQDFKESGLGWLGRIPSDWSVRRIKDIAKLQSGDFIDTADISPEGEFSVYGGNGLRGYTSSFTHDGHYALIGRQGALCGNINYAKGKFWATEHAVVATLLRSHDTIWFGELLRTMNLNQYSNAAAQPGLAVDRIKFLRLPVPPHAEQQRIAAYLNASCAAIDAAVAAKRRQLDTLDTLRKATLHAAFAEKTWPDERIKDVSVKIGSGVTPEGGAAGYLDEGIPLLRSQNVHFDGLRLDDVAFISPETHAEMSNSQLKPRDVLLNITGASIGRCTFIPDDFGEGNVNQHVCIIRVNHKLDHRFLAAFLASPKGQGQVLSSFTGASRQGLSHKELGLISIPLPTLAVQRETVERIQQQSAKQSRVRTAIETQIATLTAYRKSLVYECVTGQRRITEADLNHVKAHG